MANSRKYPSFRGWNLLCFALMGFLAGRSTHESGYLLALWVVAGWLFGVVALLLLSVLLRLFFYPVVTKHGATAPGSAASQGFLTLIPFVALALMSDYLLGWSAAAAFISAGLMFSGGATATALRKLAPEETKGLKTSLLPSLAAAGLSFIWLLGSAVLNPVLAGLR